MKGYCPVCGTYVYAYERDVLDIIERLLKDKVVTIISEVTDQSKIDCLRKLKREKNHVLGPNADNRDFCLSDPIMDKVIDYDCTWNELPSKLIIENRFWINSEFKKRRLDPAREELAVKDYKKTSFLPGVSSPCLCPLCGHATIDSYYQTKKFREFEKEQCCADAEKFVSNMKSNSVLPKVSVKQDGLDVKKYLSFLIETEKEIFYFTERLKSLNIIQKETARVALNDKLKSALLKREEIELKIEEAKKEKNNLINKYALLPMSIIPEEFGLRRPKAPEMKKPGVFNKKKIEEENKLAKEQYVMAMASFNDKVAQVKKRETERRETENNIRISRRQEDEKIFDEKILLLEKQLSSVGNAISTSGKQQANTFCLEEIAEVKEHLTKLCEIHAKLISLDIIYPKYLNFAAITTISEYLEVGRCSSLTGPDGAYNLYESELRANRIIVQLDYVISSLEEIKQNQYRTYAILSEIKRDTNDISDKLTHAIKSISAIAYNTDIIKDSTAVIAYNTAKAAYYSKVNAEMTNALGYMVAFN